jgi:hypothetical protein
MGPNFFNLQIHELRHKSEEHYYFARRKYEMNIIVSYDFIYLWLTDILY